MELLLTNALPGTLRLRAEVSENIGRLLTPRHYNRAQETADAGISWAVDNDAYSGFDEEAFVRMLGALEGVPGARFVTAPDVVGEAKPTLERFAMWAPVIRRAGFPVGLVGQDGMTPAAVPWTEAAAFFVGGSTEWKLGPEAALLASEAKRRGLWLHMGRVNSAKRCRIAYEMGCDSVDGSGWVRFKREMLPRWEAFEASIGQERRAA